MSEYHARFLTGQDAFADWRDSVLTGQAPPVFRVGDDDWDSVELGPGRVSIVGGAPGSGKTALTMQWALEAVRLNESLRACVCNVEMSVPALLDRQLARLGGLSTTDIRKRQLRESDAERLDHAFVLMESLLDRVCFVQPPYDLLNCGVSAERFGAQLLVLDYVQRISPPGAHGDKRGAVDAIMGFLRQIADLGMAVLVVAAIARSRDAKGRSSYASDSLSLASFRESSELEFGADDAWILTPGKDGDDHRILRHLKSRHAQPKDIHLRFDGDAQRFVPIPPPQERVPSPVTVALWQRPEKNPFI